jgi:hypothetical protein
LRLEKGQKSYGATSGKYSDWRMVGIWFFTKTAALDRSSVRCMAQISHKSVAFTNLPPE